MYMHHLYRFYFLQCNLINCYEWTYSWLWRTKWSGNFLKALRFTTKCILITYIRTLKALPFFGDSVKSASNCFSRCSTYSFSGRSCGVRFKGLTSSNAMVGSSVQWPPRAIPPRLTPWIQYLWGVRFHSIITYRFEAARVDALILFIQRPLQLLFLGGQVGASPNSICSYF